MSLLGLLSLKCVLYCVVLAFAPRLLGVAPKDRFAFVAAWAAVRVGIGIAVGFLCFLAIGFISELGLHAGATYIVVMLLARYGLWWYTGELIRSRQAARGPSRIHLWTFIGLCASFAVDASVFMTGLNEFRFFC